MKKINFKLSSELRNNEEIPDYTYTIEYHNSGDIVITWVEKDEKTTIIKSVRTTQKEINKNINNGTWIIVEE